MARKLDFFSIRNISGASISGFANSRKRIIARIRFFGRLRLERFQGKLGFTSSAEDEGCGRIFVSRGWILFRGDN